MTVLPVFRNGPLNFGGVGQFFLKKKKFIYGQKLFWKLHNTPSKTQCSLICRISCVPGCKESNLFILFTLTGNSRYRFDRDENSQLTSQDCVLLKGDIKVAGLVFETICSFNSNIQLLYKSNTSINLGIFCWCTIKFSQLKLKEMHDNK